MTYITKPFKSGVLVVDVVDSQGLTKKEADVLRLICTGMTRNEIAVNKSRSLGTISKHVENIAAKLEAHSSAEIVAKAVAKGIVTVSIQSLVFLPVLMGMGNYGL